MLMFSVFKHKDFQSVFEVLDVNNQLAENPERRVYLESRQEFSDFDFGLGFLTRVLFELKFC
jgi:hypothetical protein